MVGETVEKVQLYSLVVWDGCGVYQKKKTFYVRTLRADPTDGPVLCNSSSMTARANCWNGTILVANDIPQFMVNSIKGQGNVNFNYTWLAFF